MRTEMSPEIRPVLTVDSIEEVLPFWRDWLGCELKTGLWSGEVLSVAVLERDHRCVVLRARSSSANSIEGLDAATYVPVASIDELQACLDGANVGRLAKKPVQRWSSRRVSHFATAICAG